MSGRPRHLSTLDSVFLHLESERTPMHAGSLAILEGAPLHDPAGRLRLAELREHLQSRLSLMPRLRSRLAYGRPGGGEPVWVEDPSFDIAEHVRPIELDPPGSEEQLFALCSRLHTRLLDRGRPLWELWVVDGLQGDRVALVEKIHHALADGVAGVDVATVLLDSERTFDGIAGRDTPGRPGSPAASALAWRAGLLADDAIRLATLPLSRGLAAARAAARPLGLASGALRAGRALSSLATPEVVAPTTSLNDTVGPARRLCPVRLRLEDAREIQRRFGGHLNDVVLATMTGALRRLLSERGEDVAGLTLRALVPVSIRGPKDRALGNRVSAMIVSLPVHRSDPLGRLRMVQDHAETLKREEQPLVLALVLGLAARWPQTLLRAFTPAVHHQPFVNLVVTNVPGPDRPLYTMGARLLEAFPIVPLGGNLTLGVAVLSYDGQLNVGLHADPAHFPDLDRLASAVQEEFADLRRASQGRLPEPAAHGRVRRGGAPRPENSPVRTLRAGGGNGPGRPARRTREIN